MNEFTKDFRKVKAIPEVKTIINTYNRGLITLDECLKCISEEYHAAGIKKQRRLFKNGIYRTYSNN